MGTVADAIASTVRTVLSNGLTVIVRRDRSAPVVAVVTYVKAGYFDETDREVGIAHVLEHMYFKGTPTRGVGEIAKETMASGGYLNAATIYDHTSYYTVLPSSGLAEGLAIQSDAYANSSIDAGELAKELEVIIQEVKRKQDAPSAVSTETLYAELHDRHRIRRWRIGQPDELRTFGRDDLLRFYRTFYRPSNTILTIVGDVDPDETLRLVEAHYGGLTDGPVPRDRGPGETEPPGMRYREWSGDIAQAQLLFGWRTPGTLHPDTPLLDLAAAALGAGRAGRLYRAVRERQLASSVSAYNYTPTELGVFVVHAETPRDRTLDAARAAWGEVRSALDRGIADVEIRRAQRLFESQWVRRLESMDGQANQLAEWEALGDWTLGERYLEHVLVASATDVTSALRRYVDPQQASALIYRPNASAAIADSAADFFARVATDAPAPISPIGRSTNGVTPPKVALRAQRETAGVVVYETDHGVPILVRHKPGAPVVHLGAYFYGGARDEAPGAAGVTMLMARAALKGTATRTAGDIASDAEFLGGTVSSSVGSENFGWSTSVPTRSADAALALLGDVVQQATFPDAAVETERTLMLADLLAMRDDMYRYPVRLATQVAFAGHPYGIGALGTEESVRAITSEAARRWHARAVLSAPAVIAIVGDVEPDRIAAVAAQAFPSLTAAAVSPLAAPKWPATALVEIETRDKAQTALALAFPAPDRRDDRRTVSHLVATLASGLGGRFFDELRDKRSLAYTVHAFSSERALAGMFLAYIATSPAREVEAREGLLAEFEKLRRAPVPADELWRAQTYTVGAHAIRRQSGASLLGDMIDAWLFGRGLEELDEHDARVRAVTTADVHELAQDYFDPSRLVEGIVRGTR